MDKTKFLLQDWQKDSYCFCSYSSYFFVFNFHPGVIVVILYDHVYLIKTPRTSACTCIKKYDYNMFHP